MKPHTLLCSVPILLAGCNLATWGNIFVLAVTLALFGLTVNLGRQVPSSSGDGEQIHSKNK